MVDKTYTVTNITLKDVATYTTTCTVGNETLILYFMWNDRLGCRTLMITNVNDECYLQNTILHPSEPFSLTSNAVENEFDYQVMLVHIDNASYDLFNWSDKYVLTFYNVLQEEQEDMPILLNISTFVPLPNPNPTPSISCVGATSTVKLAAARKDGTDEDVHRTILIDGVVVEDGIAEVSNLPEWFGTDYVEESLDIQLPDGWSWVWGDEHGVITNNSGSNHRIEVKTTNENIRFFFFDNPTVIQISERHVGACLSSSGDEYCSEYKCAAPLPTWLEAEQREIRDGDVIYIPVALTENGVSITQPITIAGTNNNPTDAKTFLGQQLNAQLQPYNLGAITGNNYNEFGITQDMTVTSYRDIPKFYVLDAGNTFTPEQMPRGMPDIVCRELS